NVKRKEPFSLEGYEPDEQHVLKTLLEKNGQMMIDELSWATTLPVSLLASTLLGLEFKGVIQSLPGKKYKIVVSQ
ncbi:MAG TPA: DNA-protecting protein DprA, partial [Cyclobacteriaceae bacterium]